MQEKGMVGEDAAGDEAVSDRGSIRVGRFSQDLSQKSKAGSNGFPSAVSGYSLGLIQRVDRVDDYLAELENRAAEVFESGCSPSSVHQGDRLSASCPPTPSGHELRIRRAESALVEVQEKGSLVERVSQLEQRVSTLGESLRVAHSRTCSEFGGQSDSSVSSFPVESGKTRHRTASDIPVVEENHEVSPSKRELGGTTDTLANHLHSASGKVESEPEHRQGSQATGEEKSKSREPEQGMKRNEEASSSSSRSTVPSDKAETDRHGRERSEKKHMPLRKWLAKSFKKGPFGGSKSKKVQWFPHLKLFTETELLIVLFGVQPCRERERGRDGERDLHSPMACRL